MIKLEIRVHPHAQWWPCKATIRPPVRYVGAPSTILLMPCPGSGQVIISPTLAIPIPSIRCVVNGLDRAGNLVDSMKLEPDGVVAHKLFEGD